MNGLSIADITAVVEPSRVPKARPLHTRKAKPRLCKAMCTIGSTNENTKLAFSCNLPYLHEGEHCEKGIAKSLGGVAVEYRMTWKEIPGSVVWRTFVDPSATNRIGTSGNSNS